MKQCQVKTVDSLDSKSAHVASEKPIVSTVTAKIDKTTSGSHL